MFFFFFLTVTLTLFSDVLCFNLVFFAFQCQEANNSGFVIEQLPVCDLQVMEKKFKGGGYASIVSLFFIIICKLQEINHHIQFSEMNEITDVT